MAKLDFPTPPTLNEVFLDSLNQTWVYNGDAWVRTQTGTGIPEPTKIGTQMARQVDEAGKPGKWVDVVQDIWYLGAHASPPAVDNDDVPLAGRPGFVYYNIGSEKMFSWDGEAWRPFAPTYEIFGLTSYTYKLTGAISVGTPLTGPDIYGNTPSGWQSGQTLVTVFRNAPAGADADTGGSRLMPQIDSNVEGTDAQFSINYSLSQVTPINVQWEIGDLITVQISQIQLGQDASTFPWVTNDPISSSPADETKVPTQAIVKDYVIEYVDATSSYNTIAVRTEFVSTTSLRVLPGKIIAHNSGNIINFDTALIKTTAAGGWQEGNYGRGYNSITPTKGRRIDGVFVIQDPIRNKQDVCISQTWNCADRDSDYTDYQLVGVVAHGEANGSLANFQHIGDTVYFSDSFLYWGKGGYSSFHSGMYDFNDPSTGGPQDPPLNVPQVCTLLVQSEFRYQNLSESSGNFNVQYSAGDNRGSSFNGIMGGWFSIWSGAPSSSTSSLQLDLPLKDGSTTFFIGGSLGTLTTFTVFFRINGIRLNPYMIPDPASF